MISNFIKRVTSNDRNPTSPRSPHGKENKLKNLKDFLKWTVDDVCLWLESRGLGQYSEHFRRSKVNGESLAGLNEHQMRQELKVIENPFHLRSLVSARNALLGLSNAAKDKDYVRHWSVEDVSVWLESHEIFTLREQFKKYAIHGALLLELTREDIAAIGVSSPLLAMKVTLLIQQLTNVAPSQRDKLPVPLGWHTARVGDWLDSIGLAQYKDVFETNSIDGIMLAHIDEQMMTLLGVHNPLHRRSIVLALAQLTTANSAAASRRSLTKRDRVCEWSADKVAEWLANNDFDDRKLTFRTNGIHGALFVTLSDVDLASRLSMSNSIERARLLRDIRRLCGEPGDVAPHSPPPPTRSAAVVVASNNNLLMKIDEPATTTTIMVVPNTTAAAAAAAAATATLVANSNYSQASPKNSAISNNIINNNSSNSGSNNNSNSGKQKKNVNIDDDNDLVAAAASSNAQTKPVLQALKKAKKIDNNNNNNNNNNINSNSTSNNNVAKQILQRKQLQQQNIPLPPPENPPPPTNAPPCLVCNEASAECRIGPCGHCVACTACAAILDTCPRCSGVVETIINL